MWDPYECVAHPALEDHFKNVSAASPNEEQQNGMMIIGPPPNLLQDSGQARCW